MKIDSWLLLFSKAEVTSFPKSVYCHFSYRITLHFDASYIRFFFALVICFLFNFRV